MTNHSNAAPHVSKSTNHNISAALKRRAQAVINDKSMQAPELLYGTDWK